MYKTFSGILDNFCKFYKHLYTSEPVDSTLNELFLNNLSQVTQEENSFLNRQLEKTELLSVLKEMDPSKSPGSDGLSSLFYIKFFHLFGDILENIFKLCFSKGEMSESQKL